MYSGSYVDKTNFRGPTKLALIIRSSHYQKFLLSEVLTIRSSCFQKFLLSEVLTIRSSCYQKFLLSEVLVIRSSYYQKFLLSEVLVIRSSCYQDVQWEPQIVDSPNKGLSTYNKPLYKGHHLQSQYNSCITF